MAKIEKRNIQVDWKKQHEEKNISWKDYPVYNTKTGKNLKNPLGFYFETWKQYFNRHN